MSSQKYKWLEEPTTGLVEGLLSCGLITPDTRVIKKIKSPNLNTRDGSASKKNLRNAKTSEASRNMSSLGSPQKHMVQPTAASQQNKSTTKTAQTAMNSPKRRSSRTPLESFATPPPRAKTACISPRESSDSPSRFPNIIQTKRTFAGKKEAMAVAAEYHQQIDYVKQDQGEEPQAQADMFLKMLDVTLFTFNQVIIHIRGYSEDHAKLLVDIKQFFTERVKTFPEIIGRMEQEIENSKKEQKLQADEIDLLNLKIEDNNNTNEKLMEELHNAEVKINALNLQIADLTEQNNNLIFQKESLENNNGNLMFKLSKSEEIRNQQVQANQATEEILANCRTTVKTQEELIKKYEEEGAGFRPMYLKVQNENSRLLEEISTLKEKMSHMIEKQETEEIAIQTDDMKLLGSDGKKSTKKKIRSGTTKKVAQSGYALEKSPSTKGNSNKSSQNFANTRQVVMPYVQISENGSLNDIRGSAPLFPLSESSDESSSNVRLERKMNNKGKKSRPDIQNESSADTITSLMEDDEEPSELPDKSQMNTQSFNSTGCSTSNSLTLISTKAEINELPNDYIIDPTILRNTPSLVNTVFRLFPQPIELAAIEHGSYIDTILGKTPNQHRPYQWLVHNIIDFFHSIIPIDQHNEEVNDVVQMLKNFIFGKSHIQALADRIFFDIIHGCETYKLSSRIVGFFLKFLRREYTKVEYHFFNMLFNLSFPVIYPPIASIIEDPDLSPNVPQFLIHLDSCKSVLEILFPNCSEEMLDIEDLKSNTSHTPHTDLVDFWQYSMQIITIFDKIHSQFHQQVKNVFTIVGWAQSTTICREHFNEFFIIVEPLMDQAKIDKLWDRFTIENKISNVKVVTNTSFIKFCVDFPDIANKILSLIYLTNFQAVYQSLSGPLESLLQFMKKRLTFFLRYLYFNLNDIMKQSIRNQIYQIRNSFLRVNMSTAITCYRHILQFVDLKMTEEQTFIVLLDAISPEEIGDLVGYVRMRERLAFQHLSCNAMIESIDKEQNDEKAEEEKKDEKTENEEEKKNEEEEVKKEEE